MSIVLDGSNLTTTGVINSGTAVASTSGTAINFTGIPAGVKRITVMFNGVSTSGTSNIQIQIGSGSVITTGYNSAASQLNTSGMSTSSSITSGFVSTFSTLAATSLCSGQIILTNQTGNSWVDSGLLSRGDGVIFVSAGTAAALSGSLDRVRITTVNGTDTFDAGSINILYE
jgi:hypothetical protein